MSETNERKIVEALEQISRVLTGILLKDVQEADQIQKIARLKECGFQNTEIASILGTTRNTVNVAVHSLRAKKKPKKGKVAKRRG